MRIKTQCDTPWAVAAEGTMEIRHRPISVFIVRSSPPGFSTVHHAKWCWTTLLWSAAAIVTNNHEDYLRISPVSIFDVEMGTSMSWVRAHPGLACSRRTYGRVQLCSRFNSVAVKFGHRTSSPFLHRVSQDALAGDCSIKHSSLCLSPFMLGCYITKCSVSGFVWGIEWIRFRVPWVLLCSPVTTQEWIVSDTIYMLSCAFPLSDSDFCLLS